MPVPEVSTIMGLPIQDHPPGNWLVGDGGVGAYRHRQKFFSQYPTRWQIYVTDYLNVGSWRANADPTLPFTTASTEAAGSAASANPVDEFENQRFLVKPGWTIKNICGLIRANSGEITDFEIVLAAIESTAAAISDGYKNNDNDQTYTELARWQLSIDGPVGATSTTATNIDIDVDYTWVRMGDLTCYVRNMTPTPVTTNRYISFGAVVEFDV